MKMTLSFLMIISLFILWNCEEESLQPPQPTKLPFELTRADEGNPLTDQELTDFTKRLTGAWKNADFFNYLEFITYGVERDNPQGMPYYATYWSSVRPIKEGNKITMYHIPGGSAENIFIPHPVLLVNTMAMYVFTKDEKYALLADELARGLSAQYMGLVWDESVPEEDRHIMARSIINNNYEVQLSEGRTFAVDYEPWHIIDTHRWNTHFINIPNNPYWGDIYAQNMRSKDDVCHVFRGVGMMEVLAHEFASASPEAYEGVTNAIADVKAFAKDVVDYGYHIRTVDVDGTIYIPDQDLASFMDYGPEQECNARISSAFLGYETADNVYGEDIDCGNGIAPYYEMVATTTHLWNWAIIRNFHMSAILQALNNGDEVRALELLNGLIQRVEEDMDRTVDTYEDKQEGYNGDLAGQMVKYACCGLPLTSEEVRFIHQYYDMAIEDWNNWEYWDLWDESHGDGEYPYKPDSLVDFEDVTSMLQYCASPYKNEAGAEIVDCDIIRDPAQW